MKFLVIILALALSACGIEGEAPEKAPGTAVFEDVYADVSARLLKVCAGADRDCALSPFTFMTSCSMLCLGSGGRTRAQIEEAVGLDGLSLAMELDAFGTRLQDQDGLCTAGSLWTKAPVKTAYREMAGDLFFAEIKKGTDRNKIDRWAENRTDGMIKEVTAGKTGPCVFVSAASMKAGFEEPFGKAKGTFHSHGAAAGKADMLRGTADEEASLGAAEGFVKYYKGRALALVCLLPEEGRDIKDFAMDIEGKDLIKLWESRAPGRCPVYISSFTADFGMDLTPCAEDMGIKDAFTKSADLSGISDKELHAGRFLHRAKVVIGGKKTAAAASSLSTGKELVFDRPFFYEIVDVKTGLPVFIGIITGP